MFLLIAVVIVAAILAEALTPKPPAQQAPAKGTVPDVKDGKRAIRIYGTVWIDDPTQLAMLNTARVPIRKSGGKK